MALRLLALLAAARGAWRPQEELARLHGASFAASDAWRRVELELDRSLRAYDAVPSADAAATRAAEIFARDASFFAVVENALYVSDAHDSKIKHKPHYLFSTILSMLRREPFPNVVATWDVAATGAHCRRVGRRVPCLAIAKQGGFNQTGVLIPNPYFAHVDEWDARVATWRAAIPAWDDRDARLFWRGSVRSACGPGNVARVAALTLTAQHPDRYDVRVTHGLDAPDAKACALRLDLKSRLALNKARHPGLVLQFQTLVTVMIHNHRFSQMFICLFGNLPIHAMRSQPRNTR